MYEIANRRINAEEFNKLNELIKNKLDEAKAKNDKNKLVLEPEDYKSSGNVKDVVMELRKFYNTFSKGLTEEKIGISSFKSIKLNTKKRD